MTSEQRERLKNLAHWKCKRKHLDYYESLICVGIGSERGLGAPCNECITEVEREYKSKQFRKHSLKASERRTRKAKRRSKSLKGKRKVKNK